MPPVRHLGDPDGVSPAAIDIRRLAQKAWENAWLAAALILMTTVISAIYAYKAKKYYVGEAILRIRMDTGEGEQIVSGRAASMATRFMREADFNTLLRSATSSLVLERVALTNNLINDPRFHEGRADLSLEQAARRLAGMISARRVPDTQLISLTVAHNNPEIAVEVANAAAEQFVAQNTLDKIASVQRANEYLLEQADALKKKLEDSERAIQAYKEQNATVSFEDDQDLVSSEVRDLNAKATQAKSERLQLEADIQLMDQAADNVDEILTIPSVLADPVIADMRSKVLEQETLVTTLTNRYLPKYPKMIAARKTLADLKRSLEDLAVDSPGRLRAALAAARAREGSLLTALQAAEQAALKQDELHIQYKILQREEMTDQAMYESVLRKLGETDLTKGFDREHVTINEPATEASAAYTRNKARTIQIGFLLGCALAFGVVYLIHFFDNSIKTVDEVESLLKLPALAAVPLSKGSKERNSRLISIDEPQSMCAESFRSLRATIGMLGRPEDHRVTLFTSADPAEGKTFTCVNYALAQAQQGKRTLIIDADLRRPSVADSLKIPPNTEGLTDYLMGRRKFEELPLKTEHPRLWVMTAGSKIPNPAEQLAGDWVKRLVEEARGTYDQIVLDTAPVNAVSDTLYLLPFAQVVCLVIRSSKTHRRSVFRALEVIRRTGASVSGIVLNYLPEQTGYGYYYYCRSGENYGEGVYGSKEPEARP